MHAGVPNLSTQKVETLYNNNIMSTLYLETSKLVDVKGVLLHSVKFSNKELAKMISTVTKPISKGTSTNPSTETTGK